MGEAFVRAFHRLRTLSHWRRNGRLAPSAHVGAEIQACLIIKAKNLIARTATVPAQTPVCRRLGLVTGLKRIGIGDGGVWTDPSREDKGRMSDGSLKLG